MGRRGLTLIVLAIGCSRSDVPAKSSAFSSQSVSVKQEAWKAAQGFVRQRLKAPSTASFGGDGPDKQNAETVIADLGGGKYRATGWVDSQNSFGAQIRSDFVCDLDLVNGQWQYGGCLIK